MLAYNIQEAQVVGGPSWFATEKWDIEAQSGDGVMHSAEETRQMLQAMLEERFALRIHRATEQRPAYVLTVAKGGPNSRQWSTKDLRIIESPETPLRCSEETSSDWRRSFQRP